MSEAVGWRSKSARAILVRAMARLSHDAYFVYASAKTRGQRATRIGRSVGLFRCSEEQRNSLASDLGHLALRPHTIMMLVGFELQCLQEAIIHGIFPTVTQRGTHVDLAVGEQARAQLAIGS